MYILSRLLVLSSWPGWVRAHQYLSTLNSKVLKFRREPLCMTSCARTKLLNSVLVHSIFLLVLYLREMFQKVSGLSHVTFCSFPLFLQITSALIYNSVHWYKITMELFKSLYIYHSMCDFMLKTCQGVMGN